jgi:hypothetical protein
MTNTDAFAIDTTRTAIKAALAGLDNAYKACADARIEDLIVGVIDDLNERLGDLDNIAEQIEADRAPWFRSYAAA